MQHNTINHRVEYVNGDINTNTIEGFWSILKRGTIGIYHQVSPQHLHRYCNEFSFRYNTRSYLEQFRLDDSVRNLAHMEDDYNFKMQDAY